MRIAASLSTPSKATPRSTAEERWRVDGQHLAQILIRLVGQESLRHHFPNGASLHDKRHANSQNIAAKSNWPTEDLKLASQPIQQILFYLPGSQPKPRRISDDRIEAGVFSGRAVFVEKNFREFEFPVKIRFVEFLDAVACRRFLQFHRSPGLPPELSWLRPGILPHSTARQRRH